MNRNNIFYLSLATFITIVVWIASNIYHNINTSTITDTENIQIAPIKPAFDTKTIEEILKRKKVLPVFEASSSSQVTPPPNSELPQVTPQPTTQTTPTISPTVPVGT